MRKGPFGRTGLEVSEVGFGAAPVGVLEVEAPRTREVLTALLDAGVNLVDTAACYRESESLLGETVSHRREEFVLVTKCGHRVEGTSGAEWSRELVLESVERSLRRLRTDHLDVVLLHSCDRATLERGEALAALVEAREAGKVRFCGYSGDDDAARYAAGLPEVAVLEVSVNICDQSNLDSALPAARERGLGVLAKRPIANAAWRKPSEQPGLYADYASTYHERLKRMGVTARDLGFEGPPVSAWPELALRFTLSQPGVHCAIVGTTDPANAAANLAAAAKGPLSDESVERLREAFHAAERASGARWTGQT